MIQEYLVEPLGSDLATQTSGQTKLPRTGHSGNF